jgi:hypothetical protein
MMRSEGHKITCYLIPKKVTGKDQHMETLDKILREHPFLKGLEEIHLDLITGCAANVVFKKNEFLFHAGGSCEPFLFYQKWGVVVIETYIPWKRTDRNSV